jgi:hypothetical protein
MMEDNPFLESLTIATSSKIKRVVSNSLVVQNFTIPTGSKVKFEEYLTLVSALQRDTTLKTLGFRTGFRISIPIVYLTNDEANQLVPILMKNYGLEHFVPDLSCTDDRTIMAILRLNSAGRRYLVEDGSSISKGVDVLSVVSDDINCVFLHLLEKPGLCDRRTTETTTRRRPDSTLDESSSR